MRQGDPADPLTAVADNLLLLAPTNDDGILPITLLLLAWALCLHRGVPTSNAITDAV